MRREFNAETNVDVPKAKYTCLGIFFYRLHASSESDDLNNVLRLCIYTACMHIARMYIRVCICSYTYSAILRSYVHENTFICSGMQDRDDRSAAARICAAALCTSDIFRYSVSYRAKLTRYEPGRILFHFHKLKFMDLYRLRYWTQQ